LGLHRSGSNWLLRLPLGGLEVHDLGEESTVKPLQHFSLAGGVLTITSRLLPLAIGQGSLLCHLLLHVDEHLEELAFVQSVVTIGL